MVRLYERIFDALAWRIRGVLGDARVDRFLVRLARCWRPLLRAPLFIGITGSAGKTTAKELLLGMLRRQRRGVATQASLNAPPEVAKVVLRVRPWHQYCIAELSEDKPGSMNLPLALLRPGIGVVTVVGDDHFTAFESRDGIAQEVEKLVRGLPAGGTAVLNADDARVRAMAGKAQAQVLTYGGAEDSGLRAEDVDSSWPSRLSMSLVYRGQRVHVATQLCGTHWTPAVLGATGAALAAGLSLQDCADGLADVPPFEGRMQAVDLPDGVSFVRDDFKAPLWTLDACIAFLRDARAARKIAVIGTLSDFGTSIEKQYIDIARRVQEVADIAVFAGPFASHVHRARKPGSRCALYAFNSTNAASHFVNTTVRSGDLVLLKGTNKQDHLSRIILARGSGVACWKDDCKLEQSCATCPQRNRPSGTPPGGAPAAAAGSPVATVPPRAALPPGTQVIVGLGNPAAQYDGTPHNVGYALADHLANALQLGWEAGPDAWIAQGNAQGRSLCLLKVRADINLTGGKLKQLADALAFGPEQVTLLYDDLALPLGTVRPRPSGGAGGHRGVASILEAFQTDALRRVKLGVAPAEAGGDRVAYVLTPFDAPSREKLEQAYAEAAQRTLEIALAPPRPAPKVKGRSPTGAV